jgi:prephenate dehydratase
MDENKRIIVFTLIDQPGGLRNALKPFAEKDVNLTAIDSQPSGLHDQHIFYLAFDKTTDGGDELIEKLTTHCTHVMELQRA